MKPPEEYIDELASQLCQTSRDQVFWSDSFGRVLFDSLTAERDSPSLDVSSMDGYAMRYADLSQQSIPISFTIVAGQPPRSLPTGKCAKIFTGAPVPQEAELVVRREDVQEGDSSITIQSDFVGEMGHNIRRRGENAKQGNVILEHGTFVNHASLSAIISSGRKVFDVFRKVRVLIINTGDELVELGQPIQSWQIRDSNGPTLEFLCKSIPWIELHQRIHVRDSLDEIRKHLSSALPCVDAILLTGGVSMGGTDYVPQAIREVGGDVVFHRVPIRPGRPILGAATNDGKLILGLPGNPVSVAVTSTRFGLPLLRRIAGFTSIHTQPSMVRVCNPDSKAIPLIWYRLAKLQGNGTVILVDSHGSGDLISLAGSDGVVEVAPNLEGPGPYPWYPWM